MYPTRAVAMLKLWRVAHMGRPVHVERDEDEPGKSPAPRVDSPTAPEVNRIGPVASAP